MHYTREQVEPVVAGYDLPMALARRELAQDWLELEAQVASLARENDDLRAEVDRATEALDEERRLHATVEQQANDTEFAWQPIETAPKDYRVSVLVYDASWCGGAPRITVTNWVGYRSITGEAVEEKGSFVGVTKPTHWMPLPAPPAQAPQGAAQ